MKKKVTIDEIDKALDELNELLDEQSAEFQIEEMKKTFAKRGITFNMTVEEFKRFEATGKAFEEKFFYNQENTKEADEEE